MRVACLLIPDLPLRARLRAHPRERGLPLAIASGGDARAEVLVASPEASAAGVLARTSVNHARASCAELRVCVVSLAAIAAARDALLDLALSFSPRAELAPECEGLFSNEASVFLDAAGIASTFGSEARFASALASRAQRLGLLGAVAIASSRGIAHLAARESATRFGQSTAARSAPLPEDDGPPPVVIAPGNESRLLGPLSIDLLAPSDSLSQALGRLGIGRVRDLLRLRTSDLVQRFGAEAVRLVAQARGEADELPLPEPRENQLREAMDFEWPVDRLEPMLFALRGLLSRLIERLELRGLRCGPLQLEMSLAGGGRDARQVGLAAPTNEVRVLLRVLSLTFESHPPNAPIEGLALVTVGQPPRRDQLDLFRPAGPHPIALDQTLGELEALCGHERVGTPQVADDHRPNAFRMAPFRGESAKSPSRPAETPLPRSAALAVCALRPPVCASVRVESGMPTEIRSAIASGRILRAAGPWRSTGHWWSKDERFASDHFDVQVSDGSVVRLCFDWIRKVWHVDAVYD